MKTRILSTVAALLLPMTSMAATTADYVEPLPQPRSDHDPRPPVAEPASSEPIQQAGIGGGAAYGRAGVVELGGSASVISATGLFAATLSPTVGWFFQDNLQLSGIMGFNYTNVRGNPSLFMTLLAEPSYHLPISQGAFGFLGIGFGASAMAGVGTGFAMSPRLGMNILVGRSGILTPAVFTHYSTISAVGGPGGTVLTVSATYGLQIGYTVML